MATQKVKLAFISDEKKRKATLKRRLSGFMNKATELSTLCGIDVCAIVCSPYDVEPMVRPSALGVQRVISQYHNMTEMEKCKNMFNQVTFLRQRTDKVNEQLRKKQAKNREKKITELMFECLSIGEGRLQNLSPSDLNVLRSKIEEKLTEINKRMEGLRNTTNLQRVLTPTLESPIPITLLQVATPLPVALSTPAPPLQTPMLMAQQQEVPSPPATLPQLLMPMALQQVAPPPLEPLVPIVTNDQMQRNIEKVQEHHRLPQQFNNSVNQPMDDMVYGLVRENQIIMPFANNSTIDWPNASDDPASAHLAPNPYGFL